MAAETRIIVSAKDLASDVFHKAELGAEGLARTIEKYEGLIPFASFGMGSYLAKDALKGLLEETIEHIDKTGKLGQQVGMATEEITSYSYAAKLADVSTEEFVRSVEKLSKNMVGAVGGVSEGMDSMASGGNKVRAALVALGFSQQQIVQGQQNMPEFLGQIADKFHGAEDGATKTAIAMMLFGKSGAAMIPMLNQGGAAITKMRQEAEALGLVFGDDLAKQAEEVEDNFKRLHARIEGFEILLTSGALPAVQDFSEYLMHSVGSTDALNEKLSLVEKSLRGIVYWAIATKNVGDMFASGAWHVLKGGTDLMVGDFKSANKHIMDLARSNMEDLNDIMRGYDDIWVGHATQRERTNLKGHDGRSTHDALGEKKTKLKNPNTDNGKGLDTIKTLHEEALKADQALMQVRDSYDELTLTLEGDVFGAALIKNQREANKELMEAVRDWQKIQDERKSLSTKGKLTGEASRLLNERQASVAQRMQGIRERQMLQDQQKSIEAQLEDMSHDAAHITAMAESTGIGQWEAKANAIKAKYDALRKDPKTMRFSSDWDAEQGAALLRLESDKAVAMAQQRAELAQLLGDTHGYYGEQVKILEIQRDLAGTDEERRLIQEKLNRAQAQYAGDGMDGLRRSFKDYAGDAQDMWKNWYEAGRASISKIQDALADVSVGKSVDIQKFGQDLGREINSNIIIRPAMGKLMDSLSSIPGLEDIFGAGKDAALATASVSLDASAVSLDASAIGLDTAALSLETAAISLESAALSMGAGGAGAIAQSGSDMLSGMVDDFFNLDGARASGGPTGPGDYLVGERGPEILRIGGSGYVYDNARTQDILSGAAASGAGLTQHNVTIQQTFDFRGADSSAITQLRAYASVIKRESVAEAMAKVRAEADRGGSYSKSLGRRSK
jgi:hypothetical protein